MEIERLSSGVMGVPRRAFRRGASTALALAAAAFVAAGCGGASSSDAKGKTLRVAISSQSSLNPAKSENSVFWGAVLANAGYASLFHVDPSGKIGPDLATSWRYVDTATRKNEVFELTLRPGAKFSDGTPVDAKAVAGWLKYFNKAKGLYSAALGIDPKFTATGPLTVRIEMSTPNPSVAAILSDQGSNWGYIGSPKAVANPKSLDSGTYGAGPYKLLPSETVSGDHYTFVPNELYWDKKAIHYNKIYLKVIANASTRLQAQQSGQYDVTEGDASTAKAAKAAGLQDVAGSWSVYYLSFDLSHDVGAPELRNLKVRQAISYAIGREGIAKALFGGTAKVRYGPITQDLDTTPYSFRYDYDLAKAKQLMADAGYSRGLKLKVIYPSYLGSFGTPLMNAVGQNLQAIGVTLDLRGFPNNVAYSNEVFKYDSPLMLSAIIVGTTPATYTQYLKPKATTNFFGADEQLARLYGQGATSDDPKPAWGKMWQRYTSQAYNLPLVTGPAQYYVSKGTGGVAASDVHASALPTEWYPAGDR